MEKQERLEATVCREIGARTGGEILIGVVGPVRTGKSTLIKQFMEQLVLPAIRARTTPASVHGTNCPSRRRGAPS